MRDACRQFRHRGSDRRRRTDGDLLVVLLLVLLVDGQLSGDDS